MAKVGRAAYNASKMRVETVTPSATGTLTAPTKTIGDAETGEVYFVDISTYNAAIVLPAAKAGLYFKFILSVASDAEATNSLFIYTPSDSVDIQGHINEAGGTRIEVTTATSMIEIGDGTAVAAGDFVECICDGTNWYVFGSIKTASGVAIADARS